MTRLILVFKQESDGNQFHASRNFHRKQSLFTAVHAEVLDSEQSRLGGTVKIKVKESDLVSLFCKRYGERRRNGAFADSALA